MLPPPIEPGRALTALAPMQDVTDLPFMRLLGAFGPPDFFVTEYFRVHAQSTLESHIVDAILHHDTGRPVFAQLIGHDCEHLARTARDLARLPIAGIDLNMGCPAPKVYRKQVGGGLLREPAAIEQIFATLRNASPSRFTVKMRIGFEDDRHFFQILDLVNAYEIDALAIHGRTVRQMYRGEVDYERIRQAKAHVRCPVLANGNVTSAAKAAEVLAFTKADGVMIGRAAIRNPWIFRQTQDLLCGRPSSIPTLADVFAYIHALWDATAKPGLPERHHLNRMKKFLAFIGQAVDPQGAFLHAARRATDADAFFQICEAFLLGSQASTPYNCTPFEGVIARPNHEDSCSL